MYTESKEKKRSPDIYRYKFLQISEQWKKKEQYKRNVPICLNIFVDFFFQIDREEDVYRLRQN